MAVDLNVSNAINSAYAQGRAEAFQRQQQQDKLAQNAKDEEDKAAQLKEQQDEFKKTQDQSNEHFQTVQKLQQALFDASQVKDSQEFSKYTEQTGNPVQGYKPDLVNSPTDTVETAPGVFQPRATLYKNDVTGSTYTARSPKIAAQQAGENAATAKEPLIQQDRSQALYDNNLAIIRQKLHDTGEWNHETDLKATEEAHHTADLEAGYRNNLDVENLRGRYAVEVAQGREGAKGGEELWINNQLDPEAQKAFGAAPGQTWKDVLGNVKLDPKGNDKFLTLSNMEPEAIQAQELLSAKDKDGLTGYQRYFLGGISGGIKEQFQKLPGQADPFVEQIRPLLSRLFLEAKDDANVGSRLTSNQMAVLKGITTGNERNITPTRAEEVINGLLPAIRQERINVVKAYGTKVGANSSSGTTTTKVSVPKSAGPDAVDQLWTIVKPKAGQ